MDTENWKPVVGFEDTFEVSDYGRVRRIYPEGGWRIMKQSLHGSAKNYYVLNLSRIGQRATGRRHRKGDKRSGTQTYAKVHILVLEAFVGPRPDGKQGCHRNGVSTNNRLENLYWGTWEENCADMVTHGRRKGVNNGRAKLTEDHVREIRRSFQTDQRPTYTSVGKLYGITGTNTRRIVLKEIWTHIEN